jgi:flagellar FliJ protein
MRMKKFKFSLEKVLEFDRHIQKKETDVLAVLNLEYSELVDEEDRLVKEYESAKKEYSERAASGMKIIDTAIMLNHIEDIRNLINAQRVKIDQKLVEVENQTAKLISVTQDKMTVEKLRDKKLELYKIEERKNDDRQIEEFISYRGSLAV